MKLIMENWKRYLMESSVDSWAMNPTLPKEVRVYHYSSGKYCNPCKVLKAGMTNAGYGPPSYMYYDMDPWDQKPQRGSFEEHLLREAGGADNVMNTCVVYNPNKSEIIPSEMGEPPIIKLNAFLIPIEKSYTADLLISFIQSKLNLKPNL